MKVGKKKKIKKQGMALMGVLEFVRLAATHHPEVAKEIIHDRLEIDADAFARFVQRVIRMAVRAAEARGKSIDEALLDFRQICYENRPAEKSAASDDDEDTETETPEE